MPRAFTSAWGGCGWVTFRTMLCIRAAGFAARRCFIVSSVNRPRTWSNYAMTIIPCEPHKHAAQILAIFNEAIVNSTAIYDYQMRTAEMMDAWFEAKAKGNFPVMGVENEGGE